MIEDIRRDYTVPLQAEEAFGTFVGRVVAWEPPHRLVFTWQIGFGREPVPESTRASEIEVRFEPADPGSSRLLFEHRGIDRHGAQAADYRAALDPDEGWDLILGRYLDLAGRS